MGIVTKKREGESTNSLVYRFTKKMRQSGILKEAKKRRFHDRTINKNKRRLSAIYRSEKKEKIEESRKAGLL
ncbi:MAG: 30S ribosomal protein S21 [bacterium]